MRLVGIGLALGLAGGLLASRALESQLFGVRPWDPLALAGVALALSLVALAGARDAGLARGIRSTRRGRCASNSLDGRSGAAATVYSGQVRER